MDTESFVYILASTRNGTLYVGSTHDLIRRVWEHKIDAVEGFTARYSVHLLVYFEIHQNYATALARERQMKKWKRAWKISLIESNNPGWRDLYPEITG